MLRFCGFRIRRRLGAAVFSGQEVASKVSEKLLRQKKVQNTFFWGMFWTIFGAPFFGVGFPAVRSAFLGPYSGPLEEVQNPHFAVVLPAVPCVFGLKFPLSLRFREVSVGNLATRGVFPAGNLATHGLVNLIGPEPPGNCGNKRFWLERMVSLWTTQTFPKQSGG